MIREKKLFSKEAIHVLVLYFLPVLVALNPLELVEHMLILGLKGLRLD